jgi:hypothetical protein
VRQGADVLRATVPACSARLAGRGQEFGWSGRHRPRGRLWGSGKRKKVRLERGRSRVGRTTSAMFVRVWMGGGGRQGAHGMITARGGRRRSRPGNTVEVEKVSGVFGWLAHGPLSRPFPLPVDGRAVLAELSPETVAFPFLLCSRTASLETPNRRNSVLALPSASSSQPSHHC